MRTSVWMRCVMAVLAARSISHQKAVISEVIDEYKSYLADYFFYDKIWTELSSGDRKTAHGIAASGSSKLLDIRNYMKIETNQFNPYRKRLIKKGVLNGDLYHVSNNQTGGLV